MLNNQHKLEEQMREKYSIEKLFDNASATVVTGEEDLEDFSKPRQVQRYEKYTENNPDIQDYTDMVDEEISSDIHASTDNLPLNENSEKIGFFKKIKNKFMSIFRK